MIDSLIKVQYGDGIYQGQLSNKSKHGIGIFLWESGSVYIGQWKNDLIDGEGILFIPPKIFIQGVFRKNKLHGATYFKMNEWVFEGYWCQGKPHGNVYARNIEFDQDQVINFRNGFYESSIQRDVSNSPNRKKVFEILSPVQDILNNYKTNDQLKLGFQQDENGTNYFGVINSDNIPSGLGVTQFLDGSYSCGMYQDGFLNGSGRVQQENEQVYKGGFLRGQYQGNGILIYKVLSSRSEFFIEWLQGIWASGYLVETIDRGILKDKADLEKLNLQVRYEFPNDEEIIKQRHKVEIPILQQQIKELQNLVIPNNKSLKKNSESYVKESSQSPITTEYSQESKIYKGFENSKKFSQHQQLTLQYLNQIYSRRSSKQVPCRESKQSKNKLIKSKQQSQEDISKETYPSTDRYENISFHQRNRQNSLKQSNKKQTYIKNYYKGLLKPNQQTDLKYKQKCKQNKSQEPIVNYPKYQKQSEQINKLSNTQNLEKELGKIYIDYKAYGSSSCHFISQNQEPLNYTVFKPQIQTSVQNSQVLKLIKQQVNHPSFNDLNTKEVVTQYHSPYQQNNNIPLKQSQARSEGRIKSQNYQDTPELNYNNQHQETAFEKRLRKEFEEKNQNNYDYNNPIKCKLFETDEEAMQQIKLFQDEFQGEQKKQLLEPNISQEQSQTNIPTLTKNFQLKDCSHIMAQNEEFKRELMQLSPHPLQAKPIDLQQQSKHENQTLQTLQSNQQTRSMKNLNQDEQTIKIQKEQITRSASGLRNQNGKNIIMSNKQLEILKLVNVFTKRDDIETNIKSTKIIRNELFLDDQKEYETEKKRNDNLKQIDKEIIESQTTPVYHFNKDGKQQANLFSFKPQIYELQQTAGFNNESGNFIIQDEDGNDITNQLRKASQNKEKQAQNVKNSYSDKTQQSASNSVDNKVLEQVQKQIKDQNEQIKCLAQVLHEVLLAQQAKKQEIGDSKIIQNKSVNNLPTNKVYDKNNQCMLISRTQQQITQSQVVIKAFPQVNQMIVNPRSRSPVIQLGQQLHLQSLSPNRINHSPIRNTVRQQMIYLPQYKNAQKLIPKRSF